MTRILLCGDSFGVTDHNFPGLHFSEKLQDCEIINLARGGASNAMIDVQLHQGLQHAPTHVILLFTAQWRAEYNIYLSGVTNAELKHCVPGNKTTNWSVDNMKAFNENTYITSPYLRVQGVNHITDAYENHLKYYFVDYGTIKTYFLIMGMLDRLTILGIPFCFSFGGFDKDYIECRDRIFPANYLKNTIEGYFDRKIELNLWDYADQNNKPDKQVPKHHVIDDAVQTKFAEQCREILYGAI